jgi:SAM-dependent methyltransferase
MDDYTESGARLYDCCFPGLAGDVQFYVDEARKAGSPVLELGCGTGRILLPVAEAGVQIVGLDLSTPMLNVLRQKLARCHTETQARVELLEGDMRRFSLAQRFNLAMLPYRAFLHLLTPKDQRQALSCIREHLVDNGRLILNVFDPDLELMAASMGPHGAALRKDSECLDPETGRRVILWFTGQYDQEHQLLDGAFIFEELDDNGNVLKKTYSPLRLRYVYRYEMRYLLELCGFKVEALYGDFQRGAFRYGGEQVWVARKS